MMSKSIRIPVEMNEELQAACKTYGARDESSLIRDFIAAGLKSLGGK